ncbi:MAG: NAD(P)/FAD-dependent oxidoreductase, partial [Saprospiraceae bacterium]
KDGRELNSHKLLICVNGFAQKILADIDVVPARNQVLITKPISNLKVKGTFHYQEGYYYFRNVGDRILFGGGRNLTPKIEKTPDFGLTDVIQEELSRMLYEIILPKTTFEVDMWWSGILGVGETKKPIIKKLSDNIGVAVRMGGMGIAIGSLVGEEGAELF